MLAPTADEDTIHHFRSTNGGASWQAFGRVRFSEVRDFVLRVGSDAGSIWVYTFVAAVDGLVVRRTHPDGSAYAWRWIAVGDSITRVAADRNIEPPQHLLCAYGTTIGSIRMVSSSDSAQTWGNARYVATNGARPAVAAGGDGYVYIDWLPEPESTFYWVGRYTNNLISPSMLFACSGPLSRCPKPPPTSTPLSRRLHHLPAIRQSQHLVRWLQLDRG